MRSKENTIISNTIVNCLVHNTTCNLIHKAKMMIFHSSALSIILIIVTKFNGGCSFIREQQPLYVHSNRLHRRSKIDGLQISENLDTSDTCNSNLIRRNILIDTLYKVIAVPVISSVLLYPKNVIAATESSLESLLFEIKKARQQMNDVPELIQKEQWDSIRAILVKPPISDLWTKSGRKTNLLQDYATAIGNIPTGDEFAVLEAKEDVEGHLRFLDMAVYNNVFNPIKSEGETGATKELVRSYYEDPINEYKATISALDNLIQLGNVN